MAGGGRVGGCGCRCGGGSSGCGGVEGGLTIGQFEVCGGGFESAPFLACGLLAQEDFDFGGQDGDFGGGGVDGREERVESEVIFGAGGEGELQRCLNG